MVKAFCLVCTRWQNQHWCLGYCQEKNIYIHKPHRNCSKFHESGNVTGDPFFIYDWYKKARAYAQIRFDFIDLWYQTLGETPTEVE